MAQYEIFTDQQTAYRAVERLCLHHDHVKTLTDCYKYMREQETYARMQDRDFQCDPVKMKQSETSYFTSLIVRLSSEEGRDFFREVKLAYEEIGGLIRKFNPEATVDIYFDTAHITIKSILDGVQQDERTLRTYVPLITPIVDKWTEALGVATRLYAMGLFTNLHPGRRLSIGVKFYPSLPLIQIIRGEVGVALYEIGKNLRLRPEEQFHTMLTHSTGFRARGLQFPLQPKFPLLI
ncbi:MAG: hypothetical protein AB1422_17880 [bacterium]